MEPKTIRLSPVRGEHNSEILNKIDPYMIEVQVCSSGGGTFTFSSNISGDSLNIESLISDHKKSFP